MRGLLVIAVVVSFGLAATSCASTDCNMSCESGVSMSANADSEMPLATFAGGSGVVCLNGSCASGTLVLSGGQASAAISAPQFSGSLSVAPTSTPTASFDDASTGPTTFQINAQLTSAFDVLHDGDEWSMSVTTSDGTEIVSLTRSVTYNQFAACHGLECRQAFVQ